MFVGISLLQMLWIVMCMAGSFVFGAAFGVVVHGMFGGRKDEVFEDGDGVEQ